MTLGQLSDVSINGVTNNQVLSYDESSGNWHPTSVGGGGDVTGPASATPKTVAVYGTSSGKVITNSFVNADSIPIEGITYNILSPSTPSTASVFNMLGGAPGLSVDTSANQANTVSWDLLTLVSKGAINFGENIAVEASANGQLILSGVSVLKGVPRISPNGFTSQGHIVPQVTSDTFVLLSAAQALTGKTYNGVSLATGGSANQFLSRAGTYTSVDVSALTAAIASVDARVTSVNTRVDTVSAAVTSVDSRVTSVQSGIVSVDSRVTSVHTQLLRLPQRSPDFKTIYQSVTGPDNLTCPNIFNTTSINVFGIVMTSGIFTLSSGTYFFQFHGWGLGGRPVNYLMEGSGLGTTTVEQIFTRNVGFNVSSVNTYTPTLCYGVVTVGVSTQYGIQGGNIQSGTNVNGPISILSIWKMLG